MTREVRLARPSDVPALVALMQEFYAVAGLDLRFDLRAYVMHAGYALLEDLQALLFTQPQVYVELSMAINVEARPAFYRFLRALVEAGSSDRITFGSDQMVWPGLIDAAVRSLEEAPFLTSQQKRDIFCGNSARFRRLSPETMARYHELARRATDR